ncbi:MAG: hypothetical protein QNK82_10085 [Akkermansiaceae bacterium]
MKNPLCCLGLCCAVICVVILVSDSSDALAQDQTKTKTLCTEAAELISYNGGNIGAARGGKKMNYSDISKKVLGELRDTNFASRIVEIDGLNQSVKVGKFPSRARDNRTVLSVFYTPLR